jgi:hypothetical protein
MSHGPWVTGARPAPAAPLPRLLHSPALHRAPRATRALFKAFYQRCALGQRTSTCRPPGLSPRILPTAGLYKKLSQPKQSGSPTGSRPRSDVHSFCCNHTPPRGGGSRSDISPVLGRSSLLFLSPAFGTLCTHRLRLHSPRHALIAFIRHAVHSSPSCIRMDEGTSHQAALVVGGINVINTAG